MEKINEIKVEIVVSVPEVVDMKPGVLYVSEEHCGSSHLCFCGCGNEVYLNHPNLRGSTTRGWDLVRNGEKVTINPSIGSSGLACKSHYIIRDNIVNWCSPMP